MNQVRADQIRMECMGCGNRSVGPRDTKAPARAVLHVVHYGRKLPATSGAPYYVDESGWRIT